MDEELKEYFKSREFEEIIGNIVMKAVDQALLRKMKMVDGKSEPGRQIEKEMMVNVLDVIAKYLPEVEGRLLGCQSDSAQAKNRAVQTRDLMADMVTQMKEAIEAQKAEPKKIRWFKK